MTVFGAPPTGRAAADPAAELARRFLHAYGPATHADLAAWGGIAPGHARALLARIANEVEEVDFDGRPALVLAADDLESVPPASGVRLLGPFDPYLDQRDRATLFPDAALRKRARTGIGAPGAVLIDGELAGLWRPQKKGSKLVVAVEPLRRLPRAEVEGEASIVAAVRGCSAAEVAWA